MQNTDAPVKQGFQVTPNVYQSPEGKYYWYYELKMMKNPTILFMLWKIFFWIYVGILVFFTLIDLISGDFSTDDFLGKAKAIGLVCLFVIFVLTPLAYVIYAAMNGWKYCVVFEMDKNGVMHRQLPKQNKKAKALSAVTVLAGLASKNLTAVGVGLLSNKQSMHSTFSHVRSIEIYRRRNVIKLNEPLNYNQVYAEDEDFDFILNYITNHLSPNCKIK